MDATPTDGRSAPAVTVKLFAALRDAAGVGEVTVELPTTPAGIIAELSDRFGERFAARVGIAAVMIDGEPVERDSDRSIRGGAEVALLPPFAGGAPHLAGGSHHLARG